MFRAQFCALLGIGLMLAAASTQARELGLSVDTRIGGDNNVFRTTGGKKSDGFWELSPTVSLRTRNQKLNYDFNYTPTYSTYFKSSGIDGFDHRGQGILSWRPTPVDTIDFNANYRNVRLIREVDVTGGGATPVIEESDRERYQVANVRLSYDRALTARWSTQLAATFDDYDYSRSDSIDSRGYSVELRTQYAWKPITVLGLASSYRRRDSDSSAASRPDEETNIVNISAFIQHSVTPTINAVVQAGPSFIDTKQKFSVPFTMFDSDDQSTSYFALARVEKRWQKSKVSAAYTRSESAGGGSSSASILDDIRLDGNHRFDRRWSVRISAAWVHRKEIAETAGRREETTQYLGYFTLTRRLTRQLSISGQYSFLHQDQNETSFTSQGSIGTIHTGYVSLRYTFDPVVF